ncbi:hypothetical protein J7M23_09675 [Candidatus Sumerlaeota bacterium]|nr:hypothetical protein [Candidatus Sumerlaeota bacterium]
MTATNSTSDTFAEYVLTIWQKKYLILGVTFLLILISIVVLSIKGLVSERYEVHSAIYINQPPQLTGMNYYQMMTPAMSFEPLLTSDDLIQEVKRQYEEKFKIREIKFELFKKRFKVKTEIAEDTGVRRRYSPVMSLTTYGKTPEEARFIMERWVAGAIKRYGDLPAQSVKFYLDFYRSSLGETQTLLKQKEQEYVKVKWELHAKMKELIEKENILAPTNIPLDLQKRVLELGTARTAQNVDVNIQQGVTERTGLLTELAQQDIEIAHLKGTLASLEQSLEKLKKTPSDLNKTDLITLIEDTKHDLAAAEAKREALQKKIEQTDNEITKLQKVVTELELRFESLGREVDALRKKFELFSRLKNEAEAFAGITHFQGDYPANYRSELRLVAGPVTPEIRVYPKRSVFALIALVVGLFLTTLFVVLNKYLTDIALKTSRTSG